MIGEHLFQQLKQSFGNDAVAKRREVTVITERLFGGPVEDINQIHKLTIFFPK